MRSENINIEEVREMTSAAVRQRKIALFTGAGFTKELIPDAPTWEGLLKKVWSKACDELVTVDRTQINTMPAYGKSWYKVADQMADALGQSNSKEILKSFAEKVIPVYSDVDTLKVRNWRKVFNRLKPSIAITTNYDLILEQLLGDGKTFCNRFPVTHSGDHIPVYHIHGSTMNPMDLVIFEDEAFDTMMPYSYPSLKIPSVFYEYLTLMFGYGLGDANVLYFLGLAKHLTIRGGGTGKVGKLSVFPVT